MLADLALRAAGPADRDLLLEWANDPAHETEGERNGIACLVLASEADPLGRESGPVQKVTAG